MCLKSPCQLPISRRGVCISFLRGIVFAAALVVAVGGAPAEQREDTASIRGHVKLTRTRGLPLSSNIYQPRAISERGDAPPEIRNVVVYLKRAAAAGPLPVSKTAIRQEREEFVPRVVAITRGSTVEFPNADPIFHNVFSLSSVKVFDLGRYPQGASKSIRFDRAGQVRVFCHIHSDMSAVIMVLANRFFTVPDEAGHYVLDSVPVGDYRIVAWHERTHQSVVHVHVTSGETSVVDFNIPLPPPESKP